MRKVTALVLALTLLLAGCGAKREQRALQPGECELWFTAARTGSESAALSREVRTIPDGGTPLRLLFGGPESAELTSPFPSGTTLRGSRLEDGVAYVDLSEAYGGLSGAELTLADACIVLTLCQSDEVEQVYITVEGQPRPYRDQILSPEDFLLNNSLEIGKEPGA